MRSIVRWSLGVVVVLFAVTAFGLLGPDRPLAAQPAKKAPGTELVPVEGYAVLSVNVAKLHDAAAAKPIRDALEKGDKALLKRIESDYGLTLDQVDRLTFFWPEPGYTPGPETAAVFVTTRKPIDKANLLKTWRGSPEPKNPNVFGQFGQLGFAAGFGGVNLGRGFAGGLVIPAPCAPVAPAAPKGDEKPKPLDLDAPLYYCGTYDETVLIPIDDTTVVVLPTSASTPTFVAGVLRKKGNGPLAEVLALAGQHDVVLGVTGNGVRKQIKTIREGLSFEAVPPGLCVPPVEKPANPDGKMEDEFTPFEPLAELDRAVAAFDFGPTCKLTVTAHYPTADAAKKAEPVAKQAVGQLIDALGDLRKATAEDAGEKDWLPLFDFAVTGLKSAKVKVDGKTLSATATADIGDPLKAAFAVLPTKIQDAADRMRMTDNLRQIGLALQNYHDANGHYPRDVTDGEGKVLLSWRVELLPYLEGNDVYQKIDRTKAWDDPVNKKLWDEMPDAFKVPSRGTKERHETFFQAFRTVNWVGKDDPWQVDTHNVTNTEVADGASITAGVFEMEEAVCWMKPGDPTFDPKKLAKIGNPKTGKAGVVMLDGAVRTLDVKKYTGEKLAALITINSGDDVDAEDFK